jgi:KaiC/GvpD/RAD55 family RecA-like ATPase
MQRGLTVLKMRGSTHDKGIHAFSIDEHGMHLGQRFRNITGIMAGNPDYVSPLDLEREWTRYDKQLESRRDPNTERRQPGQDRRRSEG